MKKPSFIFFLFVLGNISLLCILVNPVTANWELYPHTWVIEMDEGIVEKTVTIQITNLEKEKMKVACKPVNPFYDTQTNEYNIKEGYTVLPELSWITVTPNQQEVPSESTVTFDVTVNIPDEEQYYGNNWECWIETTDIGFEEGIGFRYNTRLQINTPVKPVLSNSETNHAIEDEQPFLYIGAVLTTIIFIIGMYTYKYRRKVPKKKKETKPSPIETLPVFSTIPTKKIDDSMHQKIDDLIGEKDE